MSQKQLRKLEEQRKAKAQVPPQQHEEEAEASDDPPPAPVSRRPGFAGLLDDSGDDSDPVEEDEPQPVVVVEPPPDSGKAKGKKKKKKGKAKKGPAAEFDSEEDDDALLDKLASAAASSTAAACSGSSSEVQLPVLKMLAADFSAEAERKRLFGDSSSKGAANRKAVRPRGFASHKRLVLVEPPADETWPSPDGCAEMVAVAGGLFDVRTTTAHTRTRKELAASQDMHQLDELHVFLQQRPFCVEGLLAMSDVLASNGQHDHAFALLRRAVYAVECSFAAGFSPLLESEGKPRVAMAFPAGADPLWPGWPWMTALLMYMAALQRQGLYRSALEVCKLMAAMSLPRDPLHVLAHLDVLCLAASQYDLLQDICTKLLAQHAPAEGQTDLDRILPNFAFSSALASQLASGKLPELEALSHVSVDQIVGAEEQASGHVAVEPMEVSSRIHARLLRAILLFPQSLRFLLEELSVKFDQPVKGSPSRLHWDALFSRRPLLPVKQSNARSARSVAQGLIGQAYARHAARFWRGERERNEAMIAWMHACAARLAQLSESSLFDGELAQAQERALTESSGLDRCLSEDYAQFAAAEVGPEWRPPAAMVRALNADPRNAQERQHATIARAEMVARAAVDAQRDQPDPEEDEEAMMQRALRLSTAAAESAERRALMEEQDRELEESLAADRAAAAAAQPESQEQEGGAQIDESGEDFAKLLEMGFDAARVREALQASGGDADKALDVLMS